jgi:broad specificity phosphatase PhoE
VSTVLLIRHASCEGLGARINGRAPGLRLNWRGRQEAEGLADRLAKFPINLVMSSPRERCVETAEAIAAKHKQPIEIVDELDEVDFGEWTGLDFERLAENACWREWNEWRSVARPPGGESMFEVQRRMERALTAAVERRSEGIVALVSHAEPIRAALANILGFSVDAWPRLEIAPAGVTRLEAEVGQFRICSINATAA